MLEEESNLRQKHVDAAVCVRKRPARPKQQMINRKALRKDKQLALLHLNVAVPPSLIFQNKNYVCIEP